MKHTSEFLLVPLFWALAMAYCEPPPQMQDAAGATERRVALSPEEAAVRCTQAIPNANTCDDEYLILTSLAMVPGEVDEPLVPDGINQILGRIRPDMPERQVEKIAKKYYPKAKAEPGDWSGQTGLVNVKLSSRHTITIAAYNAPGDFNLRFVHPNMTYYVFDWEAKRRINISFHTWDDEIDTGDKMSKQGS
jgi:hypothetical protein